jgi:hypothetical protein
MADVRARVRIVTRPYSSSFLRLTRARNVTKPSRSVRNSARYSASLRRGTARPRCSIRRCLNAHQADRPRAGAVVR